MKLSEIFNSYYQFEQPLNEGGAQGHMANIVEDPDLTFGDLKKIFTGVFSGDIIIDEKCLSPDTIIQLKNHGKMKIADVVCNKIKDKVLTYDFEKNCTCYENIEDWVENTNTNDWLKIILEDGRYIICTPNHRIYNTKAGIDVKAEELSIGDELIVND